MANITFEWSSKDLALFRDRKIEKAINKALKKAGGDAIRALRAEGKRQVRDRRRIRAGYLADKSLPLTFPKGSDPETMEWVMRVSGAPIPLGEYPRRQTKKGVSVEVNKGERKLIDSAFLATRKNGRTSVFLRPTAQRYPMGHRLGPNVSDTMKKQEIVNAVTYRAKSVFRSAFDRLVQLELAKIK